MVQESKNNQISSITPLNFEKQVSNWKEEKEKDVLIFGTGPDFQSENAIFSLKTVENL